MVMDPQVVCLHWRIQICTWIQHKWILRGLVLTDEFWFVVESRWSVLNVGFWFVCESNTNGSWQDLVCTWIQYIRIPRWNAHSGTHIVERTHPNACGGTHWKECRGTNRWNAAFFHICKGSELRSSVVTLPAMKPFQDVDVTGECLALRNLGNNLHSKHI